MEILPINNFSTQNTQFKAKFSQKDVKEFLRELEGGDIDIAPRLYTMLDVIKKNSGEKAEIEHLGMWHRILIDGKSLTGKFKYFSAFHALQDATVKLKNSMLKKSPIKRLSEEEFENTYYKNCKKTVQDIENLFISA